MPTISTISFFSAEPNQQFLDEMKKRGYKVIVWLPPKKARKNARYPTSKFGTLLVDMDREHAHTIARIGSDCGVDVAIGGWSSHAIEDKVIQSR